MDGRVLVLTIPSAVILGALVHYSLRALPRTRSLAFWASVTVLHGIAVHLVTEKGLGASFPYVIRHPLLSMLGVSLQEIAGWTIVSYLGWWLGYRFARSTGRMEPRLPRVGRKRTRFGSTGGAAFAAREFRERSVRAGPRPR